MGTAEKRSIVLMSGLHSGRKIKTCIRFTFALQRLREERNPTVVPCNTFRCTWSVAVDDHGSKDALLYACDSHNEIRKYGAGRVCIYFCKLHYVLQIDLDTRQLRL